MIYKKYIKRFLDIIFSLFFIILLSPLFLLIIILILLKEGRPSIFKQKRVGYKEEIFSMYKFRTMTNEKDKDGNLLPNNERVTKFGNFLRRSSLDELPELVNILKGDMSFIGPRPLLVRYLPYYEEEERRRHDLRPGLTGLSQVKGRNKMTWRERFKWDVKYVDNVSFKLDCKILWETVKVVLTAKNVADAGEEKVDEFGEYSLYNGRKYRPFDKEREYEIYLRENNLSDE